MTPKEALKRLLNENLKSNKVAKFYDIVWDALNRLEELENVLKIIKEKDVDIARLKSLTSVSDYNDFNQWLIDLTETEFDLLKEYLK